MQRRHRSSTFRVKTESVEMLAVAGIHWPWKGLSSLLPRPPARAVVVGPRAAGFASDEPMEVTVVVDDRDKASLESRFAEIAAVASEAVPRMQPHISILSAEQWERQQASELLGNHHNIWLAPDTASRRDGA